MPSFGVDDIDIDPYDFVTSCNNKEIGELIDHLVSYGYIEKNEIKSRYYRQTSVLESEFVTKMEELSTKYYSLSKEDERILETIFKKYL